MMTLAGSRKCVSFTVSSGRRKLSRETVAPHRLSATTKETIFPSHISSMCKFPRPCQPNSPRRCCLQFGELGALCGVIESVWVADTWLAHVQARKLSRPPSSTVLDAHTTVSAAATPEFAVSQVGVVSVRALTKIKVIVLILSPLYGDEIHRVKPWV